jgi:uncharacterized membrane protein YfcA
MDFLTDLMPLSVLLACLGVGLVAGVIKGIVGFAMPMIMISGMSGFVAPELALAGLILPTVVTNGWQALRQGWRAAWGSIVRFRTFLIVGFIALVISAQLVRVLPADVMLLMIGVPIVLFAVTQLLGKSLTLGENPPRWIGVTVAAFAGLIGGFSGVWGPPTVAYLTALNVEKKDAVRAQGVIYGLGAVALFGAHVGSGVMNAQTLPFSAALVVPALIGMWIGFQVQDRIDQAAFRKATLVVLLVAGGNLVRRGLMG